MIKSHEIRNVMDFNVADSMRRDIKILVTKTCYKVAMYKIHYVSIAMHPYIVFITIAIDYVQYIVLDY